MSPRVQTLQSSEIAPATIGKGNLRRKPLGVDASTITNRIEDATVGNGP